MESLYRTADETPNKIKGKVEGQIPLWLSGDLYRNGPGIFEVGDSEYNHWFDGLALLHRFEIGHGEVSYQSRYIRSETYNANTKANKIIVSEYGTAAFPDPCKNIFQRMFAWFQTPVKTSNTVVTVTPLSDFIYASTETNIVHKVDPKSLETLTAANFSKYVVADVATAHLLREPDGTLHNLAKSYKGKPKYSFLRIPVPSDGKEIFEEAEIVGSVPFRWSKHPTYLHSFGMSENYYVFVELALTISVMGLMATKLTNNSFAEILKWYGDEQNLFHVVDRRTGKEVHVDSSLVSDPFFMFHHINTYEEDGNLVVDVVAYEDPTILDIHYLKNLRSEERDAYPEPSIRRYVLPLSPDSQDGNLVTLKDSKATAVRQDDGKILCKFETLADVGFDLPQVNNTYRGKKYRYIYGAGGPYVNKLVKLDAATYESWDWQETGVYVSEPIFVSSPGATDEDDGVLLSVLYEIKEPRHMTHVLVLDARTMAEIARVRFEVSLPRDIHACFVQDT